MSFTRQLVTVFAPLAFALAVTPASAQNTLTIHQINVQQGDCTLIVGPDQTTFLIDAGNNGKGTAEVVPYLQSILQPAPYALCKASSGGRRCMRSQPAS